MTVLDLPIERQKEIAKSRGMTLEAWIEESKKSLEEGAKHLAKVKFVTKNGKAIKL